MSKILGIDYGKKKSGLALSDELKIIAKPYDVIEHKGNIDNLIKSISKICISNNIEKIVLGLPIESSGNEKMKIEEILFFKDLLEEKIKLEVVLENEILTSRMASEFNNLLIKKKKNKKTLIDDQAAALILQSYLDRLKNKIKIYEF